MSSNLEVVRNISADHAKAILLLLCTDRDIRVKAAAYARRIEHKESTNKRKPESSVAICVHCDQPFYPDDKDDTSCVQHDGSLEVNYKAEIWKEIEDDAPIASPENEEDYPEGFNWTCCGTVGTSAGCKKGPHQADPEKSRRSRYDWGEDDD